MRGKGTLCKVQNTIYVYVEESTSKHRASSSSSEYYACRDTLADSGKEFTSDGRCAARNQAYGKGAYDDRDTETPERVKLTCKSLNHQVPRPLQCNWMRPKEKEWSPLSWSLPRSYSAMEGEVITFRGRDAKIMPKEPSSNSAGNPYQSPGSVGY